MSSPIIVALDHATIDEAMLLVEQLSPSLCQLKVGKRGFILGGPAFVEDLIARGFSVFLDLKFHDIPQTVHDACCAAAELGVSMLTVHCQGGLRMLQAAQQGVAAAAVAESPLVLGVTVLTSLNGDDLASLGIADTPAAAVRRYVDLAVAAGLAGVVCSAEEVAECRTHVPEGFLLVTPGIRLETDKHDDQQRVMTPAQAILNGSDYLVMGRSITRAADPLAVLQAVNDQL